jgi:MFS family permease
MPLLYQCPKCAQKIRWPEEQTNRSIRCPACNETFTASRHLALGQVAASTPPKTVRKDGWFGKLGRKIGGDPALVHEGAIGGALGGILAGVISGIIAGTTREGLDPGVETTVGALLAGLFFGCIVGFGLGILIGALVGVGARIASRVVAMKARRGSIFGGLVSGAVVGGFIASSPLLAFVGAVIGCVSGVLWSLVSGWAESSMTSSSRPAPATDNDGTFRQRWEILESDADTSPYRSLRRSP